MIDEHDPSLALLHKWQEEGDLDALDQLLRCEIESIASRLRRKGGGALCASVSASDLAQEAVLRMLRVDETPHFEDPKQLRAYLWKAAWRLLINRIQKPSRHKIPLPEEASQDMGGALAVAEGDSAVEDRERAIAIEFSINLLKPEDREILELVYFQQADREEAAEKLGIARAALDMRLSRARKRLARKLMDWSELIG